MTMKRWTLMVAGLMTAVMLSGVALAEDKDKKGEEDKKKEKSVWLESYKDALAAAKKDGKLVMIEFTGSDWCPPCIALYKNVFSKNEFKEWGAKKEVILLKLDLRRRTPQSEESTKQTRDLMKKYKVTGVPTVLFVNAKGEEVERGAFPRDTPENFIKYVRKVVGEKGKKVASAG